MEFFHQYGLLFSNMQWFVIVCLILGLVLLFIEMFQPGFGVFGITGFCLLALSIILRAIFHTEEDEVLLQVFQLLLFEFAIVGGGFAFFVIANKKKWLKRTLFVQEETAVNPEFSDGTANFTELVGKKGVANTPLRPSGKAVIDNKVYDVVAENFFIEKDAKITVVNVEGVKITVCAVNKK